MRATQRSGCPINLSMEVLGDRWSLLILRDMIFGGRRHYRELFTGSLEGIASNILASRLKHLVELGMLTNRPDPSHRQKTIYSLTEASIQLLPVMAALGSWGSRWLPVSDELAIRARVLEAGGPELCEQFMAELRVEHLGATPDAEAAGPSVRERLQAAYLAQVASEAAAASATQPAASTD